MNLSDVFNQQEHDQTIIDCFIEMWRYSADLMFIMAVEKNGEFSLYDNNPASRAVMGLEQGAEIHRLNLRVQFGDEMAEQVYKTYEQVIESGKPTSIEQTGIRGDGSRIYFDTLFVPIFNSAGDPVFVCGVSRDITKIKDAENVALQANEKLLEYSAALESVNQDLDRKVQERTSELETAKRIVEEALEAKSSFVARMSHEIRTPINAVIGLSHLTLKTPLSSSQKDHLHKILASGEVLLRLVNDVLDFSKIEAGKMALEVVPFSLDSIVQYAIDMNSLKAKEKNLSLNVDISKSLPKMLLGDPLRIQQVLVNLVTNAVKFTEYGGVSIRVYSETNIDNEMLLRCDVIDTGIGISKAYSDKLFKAFQQADDSITREFGGTGLGLTISRQLCELMGGDIWVKSEIGQGSTFSFTFPLNNPDSLSNIENHIENEEKNIPDLSAFSVLLAEDNIINQKVILGYLEDTFIKVDVVENGQEAINKLNEQEYDLVLMDIQMPVMDGLTATRKIRQSSVYGDIPIIAMTAHVSEEAKEQSAKAGMNTHLDKPIKKPELYKNLQNHLTIQGYYNTSYKADTASASDALTNIQALSELVRIETLDTAKAIKKLSGKEKLYINIIQAFYQKYVDFPLENFFGDNMVRTIHTLKSNLAYIGAYELSSYCLIIEDQLKENMLNEASVENLIIALKKLVTDIGEAIAPFVSSINKSSTPSYNEKEIVSNIEDILVLLNSSDFSVEDSLNRLRQMVHGSKYALDIESLINDVEKVEFELAAIKAKQLILAIQGNLRL